MLTYEAAGVDPFDDKAKLAGLPPVDSMNMLPLLTGRVKEGPRTEIHLSNQTLISGRYKILTGQDSIIPIIRGDRMPFDVHGVGWGPQAVWNSIKVGRDCTKGCLFDIQSDPNEDHQIMDRPDIVEKMLARLVELNKDNFTPDRGEPSFAACSVGIKKYKGFYGPFVDI